MRNNSTNTFKDQICHNAKNETNDHKTQNSLQAPSQLYCLALQMTEYHSFIHFPYPLLVKLRVTGFSWSVS